MRSEDNGGPRAPAAGLRRGPPRRVAGETDVLDAASPPVGPQGDPLAVGPMWTRRTLRTASWHPPLFSSLHRRRHRQTRCFGRAACEILVGESAATRPGGDRLDQKVLQVRAPGMRGAFVSWRVFMGEVEDARLTLRVDSHAKNNLQKCCFFLFFCFLLRYTVSDCSNSFPANELIITPYTLPWFCVFLTASHDSGLALDFFFFLAIMVTNASD